MERPQPKRPAATDETAAERRYWQPNPRNRIGVIVCDCDAANPIDRVLSGHAPPPTAVVWNESNGYSRALYLLTSPVSCGPRSSQQAQSVIWKRSGRA